MPARATGVLGARVVATLRERLPLVAERTIAAVVAEVPEYADPLRGQLGQNIAQAVELALGTFLRLVERPDGSESPGELQPALDGAYRLGRGEARSGRTMAALLAAYRVGARTAWSEWGAAAVDAGVPPGTVVGFAERVFAYIDQLSAASVAGHTDELATSGRVREQYLERLGRALVAGAPPEELATRAERADWEPPATLTAVLVDSAGARGVAAGLDPRTLVLTSDALADDDLRPDLTALLVPDAGPARSALHQAMRGEPAVVGPERAWTQVGGSYRRAVRTVARLGLPPGGIDTEERLAELVLTADPEALADLRTAALSPLADLPTATAERLAETLLSWLLHQGRREEVARELHVHPQTVRYRMTQLRTLYGDRLADPHRVRDLVVALSG